MHTSICAYDISANRHCVGKSDGYHVSDDGECRDYHKCVNGAVTEIKACPEKHTLFNKTTEKCEQYDDLHIPSYCQRKCIYQFPISIRTCLQLPCFIGDGTRLNSGHLFRVQITCYYSQFLTKQTPP